MYFEKRGMKTIVKKVENELVTTKGLCLYTRAKVGTHLGMPLEKGKSNSIIMGITHSDTLPGGIKTVSCDFSSIDYFKNSKIPTNFKKSESKAILTIVDNKILEYKNQRILSQLRYSTGLMSALERESLKEKVFLQNKITHLSNVYNNKNTYILYQTKTKTEAIDILDKKRLIELVGTESYNKHFLPLVDLFLTIDKQKIGIIEILKNKMDKDGVESLLSIIKKLS